MAVHGLKGNVPGRGLGYEPQAGSARADVRTRAQRGVAQWLDRYKCLFVDLDAKAWTVAKDDAAVDEGLIDP